MASPSPSFLINEAVIVSGSSGWQEFDDLNIGVRILGEQTSVPEPGTAILVLTGLVGHALRRPPDRTIRPHQSPGEAPEWLTR